MLILSNYMKKLYNAPEVEIVKVDTRDIMSVSLGPEKDPAETDIFE